VVTLPIAAAAHDDRPSTDEAPPLLDAIRVMVVDDERDARDLLRQVLQDAGATVFTAQSANEALSRLQRETIDLLISDIAMEDGDGYELIRRLRAMPGGQAQVPAIAVTAYARSEDRERALEAGYQLHVPKPVNVDELLQFVASVRRTRSAP
jgi:CheY-like chemotaxis protein